MEPGMPLAGSSEVGVMQLNVRYERALRRLAIVLGVLAFATIPVLAALFTEGRGTPAQLTAWRVGLLAMWTMAFIAMVGCVWSVLHVRAGIERSARRVRLAYRRPTTRR
jgi:hypothetical protein